MDGGLCERPAYKEEKSRQVSRTMATHHVVLVDVRRLWCDDSPSTAAKLGDPVAVQLGTQLFVLSCCLNPVHTKYL